MMESDLVNITRQPNGTYTWSCPIDAEYYRKSIRPGLYVCIGMAVVLLIIGGVIAYREDDLEIFWIIAGSAGVFLLITFAVFGLAFSAKDLHERYLMTEDFVRSGSGRSSVVFTFSKARTLALGGNFIELHGKVRRMRVYVPERDFDFVRGYVRRRVPMECEISYV